jgi:ankyrin repeat protein
MMEKVVLVDEMGCTLLHRAAEKGDLKNVKRALKYGAQVDFADNAGWTPLVCAFYSLPVFMAFC